MINCTDLDRAAMRAEEMLTESDAAFGVAITALSALSLLLLAAGEQLMRVVGALVAGVAAAGSVFLVTATLEDVLLSCVARLAVAAVAGMCAAVLTVCIFRTGLFVLGAASFGVTTHLVYEALPIPADAGAEILGRSVYYYVAMAAMTLLGAVVGFMQRREFVRISSSLLGGGGLVLGVHLVADRADATVPPLALLAVLIAATVAGVAVQWHRSKRRKRRKQEPVALGVPVEEQRRA